MKPVMLNWFSKIHMTTRKMENQKKVTINGKSARAPNIFYSVHIDVDLDQIDCILWAAFALLYSNKQVLQFGWLFIKLAVNLLWQVHKTEHRFFIHSQSGNSSGSSPIVTSFGSSPGKQLSSKLSVRSRAFLALTIGFHIPVCLFFKSRRCFLETNRPKTSIKSTKRSCNIIRVVWSFFN